MKRIILITLIVCAGWSIWANDAISYKNEVHVSFSRVKLEFNPVHYFGSIQLGYFSFVQLNYNRMINDVISAGGYWGYGWVDQVIEEIGDNSFSYTGQEQKSTMQYGINGKLHVLPLILKNKTTGFDLYLSGDLGLISIFTTPDENIFPQKGTYFDYSISGGTSIFLFKNKRIGLVIEAGYREFKYHHGSSLKAGITYRF